MNAPVPVKRAPRVLYANEKGAGLVIIVGTPGKVARTVDSCAYRPTEAELEEELRATFEEFGIDITDDPPRAFDTIDDLVRHFNAETGE